MARKTAGRRTRKKTSARRTSPRRSSGRGGSSRRSANGQADAIAVLTQQHDEARKLFQELAEAEGEDRRHLFEHLADALEAHSNVEERLVYPAIARADEGLADVARDSLEEHLIVKRLLADLLEKDLDEEVFEAKCRVLEVEVTRHLEEEEGGLFPQAKKALGKEQLVELGAEIARTFEELSQGEPRSRVTSEIDMAPPLA